MFHCSRITLEVFLSRRGSITAKLNPYGDSAPELQDLLPSDGSCSALASHLTLIWELRAGALHLTLNVALIILWHWALAEIIPFWNTQSYWSQKDSIWISHIPHPNTTNCVRRPSSGSGRDFLPTVDFCSKTLVLRWLFYPPQKEKLPKIFYSVVYYTIWCCINFIHYLHKVLKQ